MNILKENDQLEKQTFLYMLYYKNIFDKKRYRELLDYIVNSYLNEDYEEDFLSIVFNMYGYINTHMLSILNHTHFNFKDNSKFLNDSELNSYIERYRSVIKFIIDNDKESLLELEDDLGTIYEWEY